jgi:hypothetical protein
MESIKAVRVEEGLGWEESRCGYTAKCRFLVMIKVSSVLTASLSAS